MVLVAIPASLISFFHARSLLCKLVKSAFRDLFVDVDILLAPSRLTPASKITDALDRGATPGREQPQSRGLNGLMPAGNLAGLPALSLPCGFADKMPIAIQLVGRPWFENQLVGLGRAFQGQTDWHRRRPPVGA